MKVSALPFSALEAVEALAAEVFPTRWERTAFAYFFTSSAARNNGVFRPDGYLEGYLLTLFSAGNLDIVSIAVRPERQRQGIAEAMLTTLRQEPDVCSATLEVRADNMPAIGFYEKLGFVRVGTRRRYYDGKIDATTMRWDKR